MRQCARQRCSAAVDTRHGAHSLSQRASADAPLASKEGPVVRISPGLQVAALELRFEERLEAGPHKQRVGQSARPVHRLAVGVVGQDDQLAAVLDVLDLSGPHGRDQTHLRRVGLAADDV